MRRRPARPISETLADTSARYRRRLLAGSYRELAAEVRALWPLSIDPDPLAPRLTKHLAALETLSGRMPPADTLTARDLLAVAVKRSRV
jgi:hypothetical protein